MERNERYPIGEQDFKMLREGMCAYVDKTGFIGRLVNSGSKYYFLARPRRFGKSLFLSTLRYFFEGKRELFKGLQVDALEWDWQRYPLLYIDLNAGDYATMENLEAIIENHLRQWEKEYHVDAWTQDFSIRFQNIIRAAHEQTGKPVVILVDEYDKPLVKNFGKEDFNRHRDKLLSLYSNFKTCASHIRLVFLTGVSRFSRVSVFSGLNNLRDISFSEEYADICGITEQEMLENFKTGIERLAAKNGNTYREVLAELKSNYDGYRFAEEGSEIYNPWSLLNCLSEQRISNYWNETGFPTIIATTLKRIDANLEEIFDTYCSDSDLRGFDLADPYPTALMYQTGYLTIKDFDKENRLYHLGVPNKEVKEGLVKMLIPYYTRISDHDETSNVRDFIKYLKEGNPERFIRAMQTYFA